ncbi:hypothetical protein OG402_35890 [Streptomyces anulatus]|uniref:hypothetical protein n=1 Tax=Streptomyces TaxID=1883 RepID=UPI0011128DF6|nr:MULTISPECIES: hypothetical protein [Streptomyces]MCX4605847.1 hypothetical protein [Streptomyces anulatus]WSI81848.1 hypothetical protein OG557_35100 [Streptomyces anulatus]
MAEVEQVAEDFVSAAPEITLREAELSDRFLAFLQSQSQSQGHEVKRRVAFGSSRISKVHGARSVLLRRVGRAVAMVVEIGGLAAPGFAARLPRRIEFPCARNALTGGLEAGNRCRLVEVMVITDTRRGELRRLAESSRWSSGE